jgi:prevent-host-death family protein
MTTVSIAQAKDGLPALVSAAQAGETVTITRHGKPVAALRAIDGASTCDPASIDWVRQQLAALPRVRTSGAAAVRAMRDEA